MKKSNQEVLEPQVEEMEEVPLEKVIEKSLVKANVTNSVIAELKDRFGGMKLKSIDDKESYLEIVSSRRQVRSVGILVEKCCKAGRQSAIEIQKMWLNKEKSLLDKIAEVQDPLDAEIKKFEDEVERKENEEKQRREESFIARQASLLKYGAEYKNGNYELGEISYETELVKQADNEMWDEVILPKYRKVYERKEADRVAEEEKRKADADRQEKERKELEEKQAAFRKEQEEFERQKKERERIAEEQRLAFERQRLAMQRQKEESEKIIREAQQKQQQEELQKIFAIRNKRVSELKNLGCHYDAEDEMYYFQNSDVISGAEIESLSEKEWYDFIAKTTPLIEKIISDEEEKRLAKIEKEKQEADELAAKKERERIAEEQRLAEIKKAEEMAQASDKEKYQDTVNYLINAPIHEMKSGTYKKKMNIIKDFIDDLKEN